MNKTEWKKIKELKLKRAGNYGDLFKLCNLISIPLVGNVAWWVVFIQYRFFTKFNDLKRKFKS